MISYATWLKLLPLWLFVSPSCYCFNLENRLPITKRGASDTYFGYSVASHTVVGEDDDTIEKEKWLLVGAPLGQNYQPETNHSGALFKCPITQSEDDCVQIMTDGLRSEENESLAALTPPHKTEEIKDGQWLGVTVRSQGLAGKVLVCAHRYISINGESQHGRGLCYVLKNDLTHDDVYEPCKGRSVQRDHEDYGYCQVGTSGALLDDNTMVLGTPGPFTWRGTIFVTEIGGDYLRRNKNIYYSDHSETSSPVDKYSYLGMAVTGGRYFSDEMAYAAGAPRSNGNGEVVLFTKSLTNPIPVKMIIKGEQFASSFGYELATADVNGDGYSDLLVAAPFYFTKTEGGAVYVYQNEKYKLPAKPTLKLTGKLESRFGLALANIGDINKDKCEDIAIGAPYEGDGVVYIYLGTPKGLSSKPSQIIAASDLGLKASNIVTFGSSIAGGTDLDGNTYPDIAIGAYKSSKVVALLARPITNIKTDVRSTELSNIDPNKQGCKNDPATNLTCFSFHACCTINPYEGTPSKTIDLIYTIEAEIFANMKKLSRVFFDRDGKRTNIIRRKISVETNGKALCTEETAYIKENTRDIQSPLKFQLNYTIVEPRLPNSGLKGLYPILDQTEANRIFEGTFHKDCGSNDICESNLQMNSEIDLHREGEDYTLNLGESEELKLNVNITNAAESAYEAQLFIVHQETVTYIAATKATSVICNRHNATMVICGLGNPMRRNSSAQISIRFDPRNLADSETKLSFRVFANTTSTLIGPLPDKKINVRVIKRAELTIKGWAQPEQSFYGGEVKGESAMEYLEDIGTTVRHTFQIYNNGPWKAPHVVVNIQWPYQVANDKKQGKWLLYLESTPFSEGAIRFGGCTVDKDAVNPLNLKKRPAPKLEKLDIAPEPYMYKSYSEKSSYSKSSSNETHLNRLRRDIAKIIRAEALIDKDGQRKNVVIMDCEKKTAFCVNIRCDIFNMPRKSEIYINVVGRLWNSTLVSDYPRVDVVQIVSRAQIEIPPEHANEQNYDDNKVAVETKAYPELLDQVRDSPTPIWIIVVAVLSGLLVLALLAFVMWKCGFFKRRRPDPTLSGNLKKSSDNQPENKPFL